MPRLPLLSGFVSALLFVSGSVQADTLLFANMTNDQEVPPAVPTLLNGDPRPASFGTASFVLNDARTAMSFTAIVNNIDVTGSQTDDLNDDLVAAHIHAGPTGVPGSTAGVVWGFFGNPDNDDEPSDTTLTPFGGGQVGGTFSGTWNLPEGNNTTLADQIDNILAGRSYINFHTYQFGSGEIRGQIVPEPSTWLMLAAGGVALLIGWRRRGWGTIQPG